MAPATRRASFAAASRRRGHQRSMRLNKQFRLILQIAVNEIINGRKQMTAETAMAVGLALDTGAELWVNLQTAYDLFHAPDPDPAIAQRAKAICHA